MRSFFSSRASRRGLSLLVAGAAVLAPVAIPAIANTPATPKFGPIIEDYADYNGQKRCKPKAKPGVLAFQQVLQTTYPDSTWFGISRACNIGGTSEHKEGRAIDWSRDATNPYQRKTVSELLEWMFATDEYGNEHAMVRRLGIMYIIWNRRIWSTWDQGWDIYCIQKKHKCKDPDSKSALHPHTDHVHVSFGWDGARMETSFWNPELSRGELPAEEPPPVVETTPPADEQQP
jgi:hypothetical protein